MANWCIFYYQNYITQQTNKMSHSYNLRSRKFNAKINSVAIKKSTKSKPVKRTKDCYEKPWLTQKSTILMSIDNNALQNEINKSLAYVINSNNVSLNDPTFDMKKVSWELKRSFRLGMLLIMFQNKIWLERVPIFTNFTKVVKDKCHEFIDMLNYPYVKTGQRRLGLRMYMNVEFLQYIVDEITDLRNNVFR